MRWQSRIALTKDNTWISSSLADIRICAGRATLYVIPPFTHGEVPFTVVQCNGFSAGVNPDDFRGPGFQSGYDPCWVDLLSKHAEEPFHVLVGGGDQLYCDGWDICFVVEEIIAHLSVDLHGSLNYKTGSLQPSPT